MTTEPEDHRPRVLIIEDDLQVVQGLSAGLRRAGFDVSIAMDGDSGAQRALSEPFEAVVLDLMLPGRDGYAVLEAMSGRVSVPVVVLSARSELTARLRSFQLGAVDFVPKPFWMEELVARLRSRLALRAPESHRVLHLGTVEVDLDARRASRDSDDLGLTPAEMNVLIFLAERPGRAVSRLTLVERALPEDRNATERTVDSHVSRLRRKLGPEGAWLSTVWGIGYRLDPESAP